MTSLKNKKPTFKPKPFESMGNGGDTSANIYMSMLMSSAYKSLSPKQQQLYTYCKAQYYAEKEKTKPEDFKNQEFFSMNRSKYGILYELYSPTDQTGFIRDMTALIEHGFFVCASSGYISRTKTYYRFSDKWKVWGTDAFELLPNEMTASMLKNRNRKG